MKFEMLKDKNEVVNFFRKEGLGSNALDSLRGFIHKHYNELSSETIKNLINLYVYLLNDSYLNTDERQWAEKNSDYFSGNVRAEDSKYADLFRSKKFTLNDVINFTKHIADNYSTRGQIDFSLRVAEVVLRDDVDFHADKEVLANTCIEVMEIEIKKNI